MKTMKNKYICRVASKLLAVLSIAFAGAIAASCEDENYLTYDTDYNGAYFTSDTMQYSFGVLPVEVRTVIVNIPVSIMGPTSSSLRTIGVEVMTDTTTAVEGEHYILHDAVVLADSVSGYIPVELLRDGLKGSFAEGYERYRLGLRLVANENFVPTLNVKNQKFVLNFDNSVEQPNWLNAYGEKVWIERELGKWHPLKFIKMVEYFHAIEDILPETYEKMVLAYGENLENIPFGDPHLYRTIFRKYIYYPMYEYFSNPDNRDFILSEFPDFPFDFPNPFA